MNDPAEQWLPTAFAVLQNQWAYDFLFSDDEPLLHNALVNGYRVAGTFHIHSDPTLPLSSPCDLAEEGSMLFFSAFNRDVYTAGFEVTHHAKSAQAINTNHRYISRIIRDDATAALFTVARHDHLQLTEVTFCRPQTPGYRFQARLMFRTDAFNRMLRESPTHFDARAARDALALSFCTSEWRQCPQCASFDSQLCGCALQNRLRHGAADRRHDLDSLLLHSGAFDGLVNISMYAQPGAPAFIQKSARARSFIGVRGDENRQHALAAWAMQHVSRSKPFNLLRLGVPDAAALPLPAVEDGETRVCASATDLSLDLEDPLAFLDHVDLSVMGGADGDLWRQLEVGDACKGGELDGAAVEEVVWNDGEQEGSSHVLYNGDVYGNGVSFLSTGDDLVDAVGHETPPVDTGRVAASTRVMMMMMDNNARVYRNDVNARQLATSSDWTKQASDGTLQSERGVVGDGEGRAAMLTVAHAQAGESLTDAGSWGSTRRAVAIAPAIGGRGQNERRLDANQVKVERRKARNRASAQRSNLKKRAAVQKMKDELSALSKQEQTLRQRERQLREENLKLRSSLCK